jgi:hypothetical protein
MANQPDLEAEDGELLPAREVMSIISTDPSDGLGAAIVPPEEGAMPPQPVVEDRNPGHTLPVEPRDAA